MKTKAAAVEVDERKVCGHRWGVILAGGDGKRLLSLTRNISGDERPKQFCPVISNETLLQQTQRRISGLIDPQRTLVVLTRKHERFYAEQMAGIPKSRLLIQPQNQGTAPAILLSLLRLEEVDPDASVAIFPSDHYYSDDEAFINYMDGAYAAAASRPRVVILLGIPAETPEVEYGWIEPDVAEDRCVPDSVLPVKRFWEKPHQVLASELMERGCLWNSFVMVGHVAAFLNLIRRTLPDLVASFEPIRSVSLTRPGETTLNEVYARVRATCFSHDVMAVRPQDLAVLRATGLGWSDLGEPGRVLSVLGRKGLRQAASAGQGESSRVAAIGLTAAG